MPKIISELGEAPELIGNRILLLILEGTFSIIIARNLLFCVVDVGVGGVVLIESLESHKKTSDINK